MLNILTSTSRFKRLSLRNTLNEVDLDTKAKQCLQKKSNSSQYGLK